MFTFPEKVAFLFPGQGSQYIGMGHDLAEQFSIAKDIFLYADSILDVSISNICWYGPNEILNDTLYTQPALLTHSIAAYQVFKSIFPNIKPIYIAGHSLGEISALVACEAISLREGLILVRKRGEIMKTCGVNNPGGMAAILGMELKMLENICSNISNAFNPIQIANDNCPGQYVISGSKNALEKTIRAIKKTGAYKVIILNVSVAAHSSLMLSAKEIFAQQVRLTDINDPQVPIISNITATPLTLSEQIKDEIVEQLTSRVRWTDSIRYMIANDIHYFIELGSGSVLCSLIKRIDKNAICLPFGKNHDLDSFKEF